MFQDRPVGVAPAHRRAARAPSPAPFTPPVASQAPFWLAGAGRPGGWPRVAVFPAGPSAGRRPAVTPRSALWRRSERAATAPWTGCRRGSPGRSTTPIVDTSCWLDSILCVCYRPMDPLGSMASRLGSSGWDPHLGHGCTTRLRHQETQPPPLRESVTRSRVQSFVRAGSGRLAFHTVFAPRPYRLPPSHQGWRESPAHAGSHRITGTDARQGWNDHTPVASNRTPAS
jgi:hypothetical protein